MSLYAITMRFKPIQFVEASSRVAAIELVRTKYANAFITKAVKTQKQNIWKDRIVVITPKNLSYKPFEATYHERSDEIALIEANIKYGKIASDISIKQEQIQDKTF